MLTKEIRGLNYNKSAHRRALLSQLNSRSNGSVEFKHQNISAVLLSHDLPYVSGYKPRWNYQAMLEEQLLSYLKDQNQLYKDFSDFANSRLELNTDSIIRYDSICVKPPESRNFEEKRFRQSANGVKLNFLALEQNNKSIGYAGEKVVLNYERWRLKKIGRKDLVGKIQWVSQENDAAGFDILSKSKDGEDIFIEVKSTTLGKETPFYFSQNENLFSKDNSDRFQLYRVFNLKTSPRLFTKTGCFDEICNYEPISYRGQW